MLQDLTLFSFNTLNIAEYLCIVEVTTCLWDLSCVATSVHIDIDLYWDYNTFYSIYRQLLSIEMGSVVLHTTYTQNLFSKVLTVTIMGSLQLA